MSAEEEWRRFRKNLGNTEAADLYRMKVNDSRHWGPHGLLVRDVAFHSEQLGNVDYFAAPEIVEDICKCFAHTGRGYLRRAFLENTKPCIVKFFEDTSSPCCLAAALQYLYVMYRQNTLTRGCNACFDGKGMAVPKDRILKIEFLDLGVTA